MATTKTIRVALRFPETTSVGAWKGNPPPAGFNASPPGSADSTVAVDANGDIAFTGLTTNSNYTAAAVVGSAWVYVRFSTY